MSMINNLKKASKDSIFIDDDGQDDIDNMDFPLPSASSSSAANPAGLEKLLSMASGGMPSTSRPMQEERSHVAVATTPQGIRRLDPSEYKDWVCVYPCYIDSKKPVSGGRKVPLSVAVENPHAYHMAIAVQQLGLSVVYEDKRHPKDWANPGRVRVQLKVNGNFFARPDLTTRKQLIHAIAARLPKIQKESKPPSNIITPMTTLSEMEAIIDEQRKAQGLPTLAEMSAASAANNARASPSFPTKMKKQRIRVGRG